MQMEHQRQKVYLHHTNQHWVITTAVTADITKEGFVNYTMQRLEKIITV